MPRETDSQGQSHYTAIPAKCLALLPFKSEALTRWGNRSDLAEFRHRLQEDGDVGEMPWADYEGRREQGDQITLLADELTSGSTHGYHERRPGSRKAVNYRRDAAFGGFAKAWEVWGYVEEELLSEAGFYSLAHTLEAKTDIDCALVLIKQYFYRQAFICLRTFLEDVLFPLYHLHHPGEFAKWRAGTNQHLTVRGKDGAVARLLKKGAIDQPFADRINTAYGEHNPAVHGHADVIINAGVFDRNWQGLSFKREELNDWLVKAKECLEIGLVLVKSTSDGWLALTCSGPMVCPTCHSTDFSVKARATKPVKDIEFQLGGRTVIFSTPKGPRPVLYRYRCRGCGKTINSTRSRRENEALKDVKLPRL